MLVLGIESSCDESAVAIVRDGKEIIRSLVATQIELHEPYGGIVPEVACRAHAEWLTPLVEKALKESDTSLEEIDVIAATARPGLIGALLVGLSAGKSLALTTGKPFVGVDHIEGHIHAVRMAHPEMPFPHLSLVVSGGHTEIYLSQSPVEKTLITRTSDDAAGECFDKVSALLGLGYPGGPKIEAAAKDGDPKAVEFPRGKAGEDGMGLSFSGLKTAVLYHMQRQGYRILAGRPRLEYSPKDGSQPTPIADVAASFQERAVDMLVRATLAAIKHTGVKAIGLTGGVAANTRLREKLADACEEVGATCYACPKKLCGDNAAFIAGIAGEYAKRGLFDPLTLRPEPN